MRAVIDTNVWVAGFLTHLGPPARIVDLALSGRVTTVVSPKILQKYEEVLARPELELPLLEVLTALEYLKIPGTHIVHVDPTHLPGACSDPDDDYVLAAAAAGHATAVVTGNTRHFPSSPCRGITPSAFLRLLVSPEP